MAFKLTKAQIAERDQFVERLQKLAGDVETAVTAANETVREALDGVNVHVRAYNEALDEARTFAEGVAEEFRSDYDDKSETWQEGERGQAANDFICEWENVNLDEADEADLPDVEVANVSDAADALEQLPEETS